MEVGQEGAENTGENLRSCGSFIMNGRCGGLDCPAPSPDPGPLPPTAGSALGALGQPSLNPAC